LESSEFSMAAASESEKVSERMVRK
jgi:hypothetical protein